MSDVHGLDAVAAGNAALRHGADHDRRRLHLWRAGKMGGRSKPLVLWGTVRTAVGLRPARGDRRILGNRWRSSSSRLIGAIGFTYAILMAHARLFFPAHLLGRGMTFVNFLFICRRGADRSPARAGSSRRKRGAGSTPRRPSPICTGSSPGCCWPRRRSTPSRRRSRIHNVAGAARLSRLARLVLLRHGPVQASPGARATIASAWTRSASSWARAALTRRWRSSRLLPEKASDTISTLK